MGALVVVVVVVVTCFRLAGCREKGFKKGEGMGKGRKGGGEMDWSGLVWFGLVA